MRTLRWLPSVPKLPVLHQLDEASRKQALRALLPRCANCKGKHPVYHKECPVRVKERELQSQRLRGRIFFDSNFDPHSAPCNDAAPLLSLAPYPLQ